MKKATKILITLFLLVALAYRDREETQRSRRRGGETR